jgi:transposase
MRSGFQQPKSPSYGANLCAGCLEKQCEIDRLKAEVLRLKKKLSARQRTDQKGYFGSSTPSSQLPLKANVRAESHRQQGGAKPGHKGQGRKPHNPDEVDEIRHVEVSPICPDCQSQMAEKDYRQRCVLDINPVAVIKVLYRLQRRQCPHCKRIVAAKAAAVLPRARFSNQLLAEIVDSHYLQGMPLGRVCSRWQLNYGSVIEALHRLAGLFAPVMAELKQAYRHSLVRHADETRWRTDGKNGYSWLFTSDEVSLHLYRQTRAAKVVEEVLGKEKLAGYLVVDRYAAYSRVGCKLQYCYAHLLRDLKDVQVEFADDKEVATYTEQMLSLLTQAMRLQSSKPGDEEYYEEARRIKAEILQASQSPARHLAIKGWQDFFVAQEERLYHWVEDRRVPCENNRAERELRPTVIARKVSHGSQSEEGAKTREVLMSVLQTMKKRVADPRQRVKEVLDKVGGNGELNLSQEVMKSDSS